MPTFYRDTFESETWPTLQPQAQGLNRALARTSAARLSQGNRLELLSDNAEAFDAWLTAIRGARRWVHLENYIFKADAIGHRFAEALAERARAGVAVRVLYDWFGSFSTPASFWQGLRQAGVDVRVVNPPHLDTPFRVLKRDHRKLVAVDGAYASVGGLCIGDEWLQHAPEAGQPYRDTVVNVWGPAVAELEDAFAGLWDLNGSPLPAAERISASKIHEAGDMPVRVIIQKPGRMRVSRLLQLLTAGVRHRLWIADAYYLAMPSLQEALTAAARDGVDVRMLLPSSINDLPLVGAFSRTGYRPLLEAGIRIWEYEGVMMHAKTTVADGWWSLVGSTNLNITGLLTNWEIDVVVEDRRFAAQMEAMFENDLAQAREIRLRRSVVRRTPSPEHRTRRPKAGSASTGSSSRAVATAARLGQAAFLSDERELDRHERMVGATISAGVLVGALLGARFPRVLAWPLAAAGVVLGSIGLRRTLHPNPTDPATDFSATEPHPPEGAES